jgi:hypothetical protein
MKRNTPATDEVSVTLRNVQIVVQPKAEYMLAVSMWLRKDPMTTRDTMTKATHLIRRSTYTGR